MQYVVVNANNNEIIAIMLNQELAEHFIKFLSFSCVLHPMSHYDFNYNAIREFLQTH